MRHMASRVEMCYVRTSPFAIFYCIVLCIPLLNFIYDWRNVCFLNGAAGYLYLDICLIVLRLLNKLFRASQ